MNLSLGLRILLLLALVLAATTAIVHPALLGPGQAGAPALNAIPALGRN